MRSLLMISWKPWNQKGPKEPKEPKRRPAQIDKDFPTQNTWIIGIPKIGTFFRTHRVQSNRTNKLFHPPTAAATLNPKTQNRTHPGSFIS